MNSGEYFWILLKFFETWKTVEMKKDSEKETSPASYLEGSAFLPRHCIFFVKKTPLSRSRANPGVKWGKTVKKKVTERALIGSRFFSRTVLEFFWDSEEHDFHFSCWRDSVRPHEKRHENTSGNFGTVPGDCSPKKKSYFFSNYRLVMTGTIHIFWPEHFRLPATSAFTV